MLSETVGNPGPQYLEIEELFRRQVIGYQDVNGGLRIEQLLLIQKVQELDKTASFKVLFVEKL